jgi:hypothetical protein
MVNKKYYKPIFAVLLMTLGSSCNQNNAADEKKTETKTPVSVSSVSHEQMEEKVELSATTVFQVKDNVKSNISGYVKANIKLGDYVIQSDILFTIKTKEAAALENNSLSSKYDISGTTNVISPIDGVVTSLNKQTGDYAQEGEDLAVIAKQSSLVFILEVPVELKKYVKTGISCDIVLTDNEIIKGVVASEMPEVDVASQTQSYVVKAVTASLLPENLNAKVEIVKSVKSNAQTLPKDAVLTDETQSEWWVMKLINDSIAVKIPVTKGIETSDKVEIIEPVFADADRIIITGNYGLPDTAKISILKSK